jgi:hypothetical protein
MSAFDRIVAPVQHALAAFFKHDIAVRRADDGVRIVLEDRERTRPPKPMTRAEQLAAKEAQDLALMRDQLTALLDEMPEARATLRHLVFVEHALRKKGLRALNKLPLDVMRRALDQFEGLVTNWSPAGLATLRSKMAVAIIDRENLDPEAEADAYRTSGVMDAYPLTAPAPLVDRTDDEILASAYAALGDLAPVGVEVHGELGSPAARALSRDTPRQAGRNGPGADDPASSAPRVFKLNDDRR